MVHMDQQGDAEGNYTLVGRLPYIGRPGEFGLYPVGVFRYSGENAGLPVSMGGGVVSWQYTYIYIHLIGNFILSNYMLEKCVELYSTSR